MKGIYGVYCFNTYTYLFAKDGQVKEKHLFSFEYGVFQSFKKF